MTHSPPPSRGHRIASAIVRHLPGPLVRDTERVVLNMATGTVGLTSLLALREPGTIAEVLPVPLLILWSVTLIIGAVLVLFGMARSYRVVERAGLMLTGLGCVVYAFSLFSVDNVRAQIIGGLFLAIALAKGIRLLVSAVTNAAVNDGGQP